MCKGDNCANQHNRSVRTASDGSEPFWRELHPIFLRDGRPDRTHPGCNNTKHQHLIERRGMGMRCKEMVQALCRLLPSAWAHQRVSKGRSSVFARGSAPGPGAAWRFVVCNFLCQCTRVRNWQRCSVDAGNKKTRCNRKWSTWPASSALRLALAGSDLFGAS